MRKILFLDRDGVINVNTHYLYKVEDLIWVDGIKDALKEAVDAGFDIVVVTNQSGVARGYYGENDVNTLHEYMRAELAEAGVPILAFYFCPHYKGATVKAYDIDCDCRKPKPGMLLNALKDFPADVGASFLIGDSLTDLQAAEAAGIRSYLFPGGNMKFFMDQCLQKEALRKGCS